MDAILNVEQLPEKVDLIERTDKVCFVVKGAFTPEQCHGLLIKAKAQGFSKAHLKYPNSYRNNERLQMDDEQLADDLFEQCRAYVPGKLIDGNQLMALDGLNPRLRFCRYSQGQSFSIHQDGTYHASTTHHSMLTFLLYLNDACEYAGGTTSFFNNQFGDEVLAKYRPGIGDVLVFSHDLWHSGDEVEANSKYILRSDFIYGLSGPKLAYSENHHQGYIWKIKGLPDNRLATSSRDKTIKLWDEQLNLLDTLHQHQNSVLDMAINSAGDIYAVSRDGYMSIWKNHNGRYSLFKSVDTHHSCALSVLYIESHGVLTTGADNKIRLWSEDGEVLACSEACGDWQWQCLQLSEHQFVSCSGDGFLSVWQLPELALVAKYDLGKGAIRCMDREDNSLFLGFENGHVGVVKHDSFRMVRYWSVHQAAVRDLLVYCNQVISCGEDNLIHITQSNGRHRHRFNEHIGFVTSLLIENGKLYSTAYDGLIKCHDIMAL